MATNQDMGKLYRTAYIDFNWELGIGKILRALKFISAKNSIFCGGLQLGC